MRAVVMRSRFRSGVYRGYEVRLELKRRNRRYEPIELVCPQEVYEFMSSLARESSEHVYGLYLDTRHRLSDVYLLGKGGCSSALVDPKDVFKAALAVNAPAFVLVHNHPSGVPDPSAEDMALARRLNAGGAIMGIDFLDSIIVGDCRYWSFKDRGLL